MSSNWEFVRLGDHCSKIGSGATPKGGKNVYLKSGDVALIRSQNIYNEGFKQGGLAYITNSAAEKLENVCVLAGDILLNITGDSVARVCLAPNKYLPARVNQHVTIIRPDANVFDSRFLRYYLSSPAQQNILLTIASAGATRNALTKGNIEELKVVKPMLSVQKWIADQLESLDRKIEVNRQINQILEQMAQALFKSWFVDFEPVKAKIAVLEAGGSQEDATLAAMMAISGKDADALAVFEREHPEQYAELKSTAELFPSAMQDSELISIPDGWERGHVVDVTEKIFSGGTPTTTKPEYWGGDNNWFSSGETRNAFIINTEKRITSLGIKQSSTKKSILGDVLIASAGQGHTRGQTSLNMIDTYINQSVVAVRPKNKKMIAWLFLNLRSRYDEMRAISDSHSSRGSLTTKLISGMSIIIPDDRILKKFENSTFPLFNFIGHKLSEIESLAKLRDTLLPKLLSGEITLPEVEQAIGEVENV